MKIKKKQHRGWGWGVESGGQGGCERRIEVFVEMKKKSGKGGGGWGGGSAWDQVGNERKSEVIVKNS